MTVMIEMQSHAQETNVGNQDCLNPSATASEGNTSFRTSQENEHKYPLEQIQTHGVILSEAMKDEEIPRDQKSTSSGFTILRNSRNSDRNLPISSQPIPAHNVHDSNSNVWGSSGRFNSFFDNSDKAGLEFVNLPGTSTTFWMNHTKITISKSRTPLPSKTSCHKDKITSTETCGEISDENNVEVVGKSCAITAKMSREEEKSKEQAEKEITLYLTPLQGQSGSEFYALDYDNKTVNFPRVSNHFVEQVVKRNPMLRPVTHGTNHNEFTETDRKSESFFRCMGGEDTAVSDLTEHRSLSKPNADVQPSSQSFLDMTHSSFREKSTVGADDDMIKLSLSPSISTTVPQSSVDQFFDPWPKERRRFLLSSRNNKRRLAAVEKREVATIRERRRLKKLNEAFQLLKQKTPGNPKKRLPKLKILQNAMDYIKSLENILNEGSDMGSGHTDEDSNCSLSSNPLFIEEQTERNCNASGVTESLPYSSSSELTGFNSSTLNEIHLCL